MYETVGVEHPQRQLLRRKELGSRISAILLSLVATLIGLIILAWAILFITKGRFLKHPFERIVSAQTHRQVNVAGDFQLYLNPINVRFVAEGLTISNPEWAKQRHFFESRRVSTNIATIPLIFGHRRMNWLGLFNGKIDLEWDKAGKRNTWTLGDPDKPGKPFDLPVIRRALVAGTHITYRAPQMQFIAEINVDTVRARNTRLANEIRFSGGGTLRQHPFTVSGRLMSPNETVSGGRNALALHAAAAGNVLDVSGTLPGATEIEGADLKLKARGANLASLFELLGVAIPATRDYSITSNLTKSDDRWRFTGLKGRFGDSDLAGAMTISMPSTRLKLDADLRSRVLDIIDVGPWIGYNPERLDRMGAKGAIVQDGGHPRVLPDATLRVEALRNFDAHVDYRVATVRMEHFPISNIGLTLDLDRNLLKLSPLTFDIAGGHLASDISINARVPAVITDYDIRLSPTPMGKLLGKFGVEESGTSGVLKARVQMRGTGDSIHRSLSSANGRIAIVMPAGTFWTRNVQLAELDIGTFVQKMFEHKLKKPVEINCGLIAFTVRDGLAAADPILIDTKKNVITGRGGFSFRTEALDFSLQADAKTFSLFSGQSPVGVGGYFAAPNIDPISPELVTRAGVGLGLGVFASPFAAILAFIDPGDAENTACGPVLAGARASAQHEKDGGKVKHIGKGQGAKLDTPKKKKKFLGIL
ncbi:MAG TPA: AsmA family protein [Allosphingosinicella sp.]|nr:AsmA family protein [Allosphingosinicella sp.]